MVKITSFFLLLFSAGMLNAQITVTAMPPPQRFSFEDLWTVSLSGNDTSYTYFKLNLRVQEVARGLMVDVSSKPFQITGNDVVLIDRYKLGSYKPLVTNYINQAEFSDISRSGGYFPAGSYSVQFRLYGTTSANAETGTYTLVESDVYDHEVILLQPTDLITVFNHDTITEKNPVFSWTPLILPPLMEDGSGTHVITYTINLAELLNNQTPFQAITSNTYLLTQNNLNVPFIQYPFTSPELADSGTYVWQVHTYLNSSLVSSSEIWDFTYIIKDPVLRAPTPLLRKEKPKNFYVIKENVLGFSYFDEFLKEGSSSNLTVKFYDELTNSYLVNHDFSIEVKPGMNSYRFSTCASGINLPDGAFVMELINQNNQKYYLRIIHNLDSGCDE